MQTTLSNSINIGKVNQGSYASNSKVTNKQKNQMAIGGLEMMTSRNAPRSLDKYAIEGGNQSNYRTGQSPLGPNHNHSHQYG